MKIQVYVSLRVAGLHHWPTAPIKHDYLAAPHRHEFHISGTKEVSHDNRDIEFIELKHGMLDYLYNVYPLTPMGLQFGTSSCEQLAIELIKAFQLTLCTVLEDGENGAIVHV